MKKLEEEKAHRSKAGSLRPPQRKKQKEPDSPQVHPESLDAQQDECPRETRPMVPIWISRATGSMTFVLLPGPPGGLFIIEHKGITSSCIATPNVIESHFPMTPEWDVSGNWPRRTEMPFPEPSREAPLSRKCTEATAIPRTEGQEQKINKAKERSRSMDNSKGPLGASSLGTPEAWREGCSQMTRLPANPDDSTLQGLHRLSVIKGSRLRLQAIKGVYSRNSQWQQGTAQRLQPLGARQSAREFAILW